jgi:dTDP-D-glucose 4,6-dehydratase
MICFVATAQGHDTRDTLNVRRILLPLAWMILKERSEGHRRKANSDQS